MSQVLVFKIAQKNIGTFHTYLKTQNKVCLCSTLHKCTHTYIVTLAIHIPNADRDKETQTQTAYNKVVSCGVVWCDVVCVCVCTRA